MNNIIQTPNPHIQHLQSCIDAVMTLDLELYPHLSSYFRRTKGKAILINILCHFRSYEVPAYVDLSGKAWYAVSVDYLIRKYRGSKLTWQSHIIYLTSIGLIHRIRPSRSTRIKVMHEGYLKATAQGRASESWYSIPNYRDFRLKDADRAVATYEREGVSPSHLNKAGVIAARGQRYANKLYVDRRRATPLQTIIETTIIDRVRYAIRAHGYISKDTLFSRVMNSMQRSMIRHGYGTSELVWRKLNSIWANMRRHLLARAGAEYRRPTKEEKEAYCLPDAKWLIFKKNDS